MAGTRLLKIGIIVASLFFITRNANSQEVGISALTYISPGYNLVFDPGMNGAGVSVFYKRQRYKRLNLSLSGEYAMSTWGHTAFVGIGINRTWLEFERFSLTSYGHFINGLALYEPQPLYVFGVDTRFLANFYLHQNLRIFCGTGIRFTLCPGYRDYGLIETSLDIPVEFGILYPIKVVNYSKSRRSRF